MTPEEKKEYVKYRIEKAFQPMKQQKYYLIMAFGIPLQIDFIIQYFLLPTLYLY